MFFNQGEDGADIVVRLLAQSGQERLGAAVLQQILVAVARKQVGQIFREIQPHTCSEHFLEPDELVKANGIVIGQMEQLKIRCGLGSQPVEQAIGGAPVAVEGETWWQPQMFKLREHGWVLH